TSTWELSITRETGQAQRAWPVFLCRTRTSIDSTVRQSVVPNGMSLKTVESSPGARRRTPRPLERRSRVAPNGRPLPALLGHSLVPRSAQISLDLVERALAVLGIASGQMSGDVRRAHLVVVAISETIRGLPVLRAVKPVVVLGERMGDL